MNATTFRFLLLAIILPVLTLGAAGFVNGAMLEQPAQVTHPNPTVIQPIPTQGASRPVESNPRPQIASSEQQPAGVGSQPAAVPAATTAPKPPRQPLARVEMDDSYHSQLTETKLRNACGPTSLLMVLDHYNLEDSLEKVIMNSRFSPKQGGYDPACKDNKVCMSPGALVKVAKEAYGIQVEAREGWTLEQVYEELSKGRPLIADILWRLGSNGTGHFVVIYGVDLQKEMVYYHDPFDGARQESTWKEFSAAWHTTVDTGDPLKPAGHTGWGMVMRAE